MRYALAALCFMFTSSVYAVNTIGMCTNGYGCGLNNFSGNTGYGDGGGYGGSGGGGGTSTETPTHTASSTDEAVVPADVFSIALWTILAERTIGQDVSPFSIIRDIEDQVGPNPPIGDSCDGRYAIEGQTHKIVELVANEPAFVEWDVYNNEDRDRGREWGIADYGKPDGIYEKFKTGPDNERFWMGCKPSGLSDPAYRHECSLSVRLPGGTAGRQVNYRIWTHDSQWDEHRVEVYNCFQIYHEEYDER